MKIEPCPFCGSEVNLDQFERISCPNCCYRGGVLLDSNAHHNRLSRIVRAAEKWDDKFVTNTGFEWPPEWEACVALHKAVKGGAE